MIDPITIAAIGTIIVIASVLVTGPYISTIEKEISDIESNILIDNMTLEGASESIQKSYQHYFPAEIKLAIVSSTPSSSSHAQILLDVAKSLLQGIAERYVAATGEGPTQEKFSELEQVALKAVKGDQNAFNELSNLSASLISDWANRHRKIVSERNEKKKNLEKLKQSVSCWRNRAVTLQIIGLIVVLLKDIAST